MAQSNWTARLRSPLGTSTPLQVPVASIAASQKRRPGSISPAAAASFLRSQRHGMHFIYVLVITCIVAQVIINIYFNLTSNSPSRKAESRDSPDRPVARNRGQADQRWLSLHNEYAFEAKNYGERLNVLFLGDSITLHFTQASSWERILSAFGKSKILNFGVGGDRTQHLLWRVDNGELLFRKDPRIVVIMIGTNNLDDDSAEDIAKGALTVVSHVRKQFEQTKIILVGIPPRSKLSVNTIRRKTIEYNSILKQRARTIDGVSFLDFPDILDSNGVLTRKMSTDFVHLTNEAYDIYTDALIPKIQTEMKG